MRVPAADFRIFVASAESGARAQRMKMNAVAGNVLRGDLVVSGDLQGLHGFLARRGFVLSGQSVEFQRSRHEQRE